MYMVAAVESNVSKVIKKEKSALVSWVLMLSYLYYICNDSVVTDTFFDHLMRELDANWDDVEHRHKHLIDREALSAGSLFTLKEEDYPLITRHSAMGIRDEFSRMKIK